MIQAAADRCKARRTLKGGADRGYSKGLLPLRIEHESLNDQVAVLVLFGIDAYGVPQLPGALPQNPLRHSHGQRLHAEVASVASIATNAKTLAAA